MPPAIPPESVLHMIWLKNLVLNAQCLATVGDDSEDEDGAVLFATGLDYKAAKNTTLYVAVAAVFQMATTQATP